MDGHAYEGLWTAPGGGNWVATYIELSRQFFGPMFSASAGPAVVAGAQNYVLLGFLWV